MKDFIIGVVGIAILYGGWLAFKDGILPRYKGTRYSKGIYWGKRK